MKPLARKSGYLLKYRTSREKARPVLIIVLAVWKTVVSMYRKPLDLRLIFKSLIFQFYLFNILGRRWVFHIYRRVLLVKLFDDHVEVLIVDQSFRKGEVATKSDKDMVRRLLLNESMDKAAEMSHLFTRIIVFVSFNKVYSIMVVIIEAKANWPAVLALLLRQKNSEDIFLVAEVLLSRSPYWHFWFLLAYL